ncbi:unnamed protein product [Closterium sp. NIES-54]
MKVCLPRTYMISLPPSHVPCHAKSTFPILSIETPSSLQSWPSIQRSFESRNLLSFSAPFFPALYHATIPHSPIICPPFPPLVPLPSPSIARQMLSPACPLSHFGFLDAPSPSALHRAVLSLTHHGALAPPAAAPPLTTTGAPQQPEAGGGWAGEEDKRGAGLRNGGDKGSAAGDGNGVGGGDDELVVTPLGHVLAGLPVDIPLGKMLVCVCLSASLLLCCALFHTLLLPSLAVPSPFVRVPEGEQGEKIRTAQHQLRSGDGDAFTLMAVFGEWSKVQKESSRAAHRWCKRHGVEPQRLMEMAKLHRQFTHILLSTRLLRSPGCCIAWRMCSMAGCSITCSSMAAAAWQLQHGWCACILPPLPTCLLFQQCMRQARERGQKQLRLRAHNDEEEEEEEGGGSGVEEIAGGGEQGGGGQREGVEEGYGGMEEEDLEGLELRLLNSSFTPPHPLTPFPSFPTHPTRCLPTGAVCFSAPAFILAASVLYGSPASCLRCDLYVCLLLSLFIQAPLCILVHGAALYPNIAIADAHNSMRRESDQFFHTRHVSSACIHPCSSLCGSDAPITASELLVYGTLLETTKLYLSNLMRIPSLPALLLTSLSIDASSDGTRLLFDDWLLVRLTPLPMDEARRLLVTAMAIRQDIASLLHQCLSALRPHTLPQQQQTQQQQHQSHASEFQMYSRTSHEAVTQAPVHVRRIRTAEFSQAALGGDARAFIQALCEWTAGCQGAGEEQQGEQEEGQEGEEKGEEEDGGADAQVKELADRIATFLQSPVPFSCRQLTPMAAAALLSHTAVSAAPANGGAHDGTHRIASVEIGATETRDGGQKSSGQAVTNAAVNAVQTGQGSVAVATAQALVEEAEAALRAAEASKSGKAIIKGGILVTPFLRIGSIPSHETNVATQASLHMRSHWQCPLCSGKLILSLPETVDHLRACGNLPRQPQQQPGTAAASTSPAADVATAAAAGTVEGGVERSDEQVLPGEVLETAVSEGDAGDEKAAVGASMPPCLHAYVPAPSPLLSSPLLSFPSPPHPPVPLIFPACLPPCHLQPWLHIQHPLFPCFCSCLCPPAPVSASISVPAFDSAPAPVPAPIPVSAALQVVLYGVTQDGDSLCCRVPDTAPSADTPSTPAAPSSTAAAAAASLPGTIGSSKAVSGQAGERGEESDGSDDDDDALAADGEEEAEEERDEGDILSEGDSDYSEGAPVAAMQEGADVNGRTSGTCQAGLLLGVEGLRDAEQQGGQGVSGGRRGGGRDGGEGGGEREEHVQGVCERVKRWVNVYVLGLAGRARSKGQNHIKAPDPPPLLYISPTPPQSAPSSVPPPTADSHPPASSQHASTVTALPSRPPPLTHCPQCGVDMTARLGGTNTAQHPFAVSSTACAPAGNSPLSVLPPLARVSRCAVEFVSSWRSLQSLSPDVLSTHGTPDATQGGGTSVAPLPPAPVAAAPATSAPAEAAAASVAAQESKLNMSNSTNSTGVGHTITPITPSDAQINVAASPKHEPAVPPSPPADPALRTPHSLHASNTHTLHAPHPAPLHSKPLADGPSHPTPAYDGSGEESAGCAGKAETPDTREGGPSSSAKATETTAGAGTGRVGGMGGVADRSVLQLAPMVVLCMHVVSGAGGRVAAGAAGGGAGGRTGENGRRGGVGMFGAGRGLGRGGESRVKWGRELGEEGRGGDGDAGAGRTKRGRETVAEVAVADREEGGGACETGGEGSEERQEKTATVRGFFGVSVDSNAVESNVDEAGRSSESPPAGTKAEGVRTGSQGAGADVWWRPHGGAVSARGRAGGGSMGLGDRGGVSSGGKEGGGKHGSGRGKGQGNGKGKGKGKRKGNGRGGRGSGGGRGGVGGRMSPVSGESGRGGGTERAESVARPVHWWFGLRQGEGKEHSGSSGNTSHVRSTPPPNAPPRLHITPPATSSHPSPASSSRHTAIASAYHLPPPSPSPSATSQSAPAASRPPLNSPLPPSRVCLPSPAHSPLPSPLPSTPPAPSAPSPGDMESLGLMLGGGTTQATRDPILAIAHVINGTRRVGGRGKGARAGKVEGTGGGGESGEEREGRDKREGGTMEQGYMEDRERGFEHRVLIFTHCTASGAASGAASGVAGGAFGGRNAVASEGCEGIFAAREPEGTEPEWCREGYEGVGFMSSEMYGWGLQRDQERARERRQEKAQERRQEMEEEGEQKRGQERVGKPEDGARGRKAGGAEKEQVVGGREEVRVYRSEREMLQHWRRFFVFELDPDVVVVFQVSVR